jgi:hypothetical protein
MFIRLTLTQINTIVFGLGGDLFPYPRSRIDRTIFCTMLLSMMHQDERFII